MTAPDLLALLRLQDLDIALDQARHRRAALPQRATLERLDGQATELMEALSQVDVARGELGVEQKRLENELATAEHRIAEIDRRLYGGTVKASRDLQALATEVDLLRRRVSDLEDRILALLEEGQPLDQQAGSFQAQLDGLAEERGKWAQALDEADTVVAGELAQFEMQRAAAAAAVPASLLSEYERLRARLGGIGAARLVGSRCDGCHLSLPATELDRVRHAAADQVVHCDQCGRILVRIS